MPDDHHEPAAPPTSGFARAARALGAGDDLPIDPDLSPTDPRRPSRGHRPHASGRRRLRFGVLGAVFCGGALGTLGRYAVEQAWPAASGHFPDATFVINTSGAFLLGLLLTVLIERLPHRAGTLRPFLATGVLGGWTTYSTLVVEAATLAKLGHVAQGAGYIALTLVCGVSAVALGIALGRSRVLAPSGAER